MADLNSHFQYPYYRKRQHGSAAAIDLGGAVHFVHDFSTERVQTDKAHEYDQALRQSRLTAVRRRAGGSVMGTSALLSATPAAATSVYGDPSTATSAVLGDSHGSEQMHAAASAAHAKEDSNVPPDDIVASGGVGSGLGGSYIDGAGRFVRKEEEEEEGMEDGGVLGLLAQIYGRRDGPVQVM